MTEYDIVSTNGITWYYKKNTVILHRLDGPAVEYTNGYKVWMVDGKRHRENGPAVIYANGGSRHWYINDKLHRLDGPAVERADGTKEWWLDGERWNKEEFRKRTITVNGMTLADIEKAIGYKLKIIS